METVALGTAIVRGVDSLHGYTYTPTLLFIQN